MNFVIIMTDSQNKSMLGAYGNPLVNTPNLDKFAAANIRFEKAYTTAPLCTPARSSLFTGLHPQVNGAWLNNQAPGQHIVMMGDIFRYYGYRAAYTGKWHLDGSAYFGGGVPGGGFEGDWWYDGQQYAEDIGIELFTQYCQSGQHDIETFRRLGFTKDNIWGHKVANKSIEFLETIGNEPFVLVVSFDEPCTPSVAPIEFWDEFDMNNIPQPPNFGVVTTKMTALQQLQREEYAIRTEDWASYKQKLRRYYACNAYIDREIGRVINAVELLHNDNTVVIYTSDHGYMLGAHGLHERGPMMYEETCNIPFIVKIPGGATQAVSHALISHLDIIPTMLDLAGISRPEILHGISFVPVLQEPTAQVRETTMMNFHRLAINHDSFGEFYPIRAVTDGRYKLVVNLFETDEFYDLVEDPYELVNRIDDDICVTERNRLHDAMLAEMDKIRDPFRSYHWRNRAWRNASQPSYRGGTNRPLPQRFPFQPNPPQR